MAEAWLGHRRKLPEGDVPLRAVLAEALGLIGVAAEAPAAGAAEPRPFVWAGNRPLQYLSLDEALREPAEDVTIVGATGMLRWRRYGRRTAVVLLLDGGAPGPAGYEGMTLEGDGGEQVFPLWGEFNAGREPLPYVEGRVGPGFDYRPFFAGARAGKSRAALHARRYWLRQPATDESKVAGFPVPARRAVYRLLRIAPWVPAAPDQERT